MDKIMSNKVYSESYVVLEKLKLFKNIPPDICELINKNYDKSLGFEYIDSLPLEYQAISKETRTFLTYLYIKYICNSNDEKEQLKDVIRENTEKYETEKREMYNPDNIFKNREKSKNIDEIEIQEKEKLVLENLSMIEHKENIFTKIKNFITNLFKK